MTLRTLGTALLLTVLASPALAQESTRDDFNKYCQMSIGRWVGEVTWVADWPGFGKQGDKVTAYAELRLVEDGNAMIGRFYGGKGSSTGFVVYDARAKRIKSQLADSAGGFMRSVIYQKDGKWIEKGTGCLPDGTKNEFTSTATITDNGNTWTLNGPTTVGGKPADEQHDVWHRISK
jgi:hypothetical protein